MALSLSSSSPSPENASPILTTRNKDSASHCNQPPLLRLYSDSDAQPTQPTQQTRRDEMRLSQAFEEFLLPHLTRNRCSPSHIQQYRTVIKQWRELTDDPPVVEIDDECLQNFVDALMAWYEWRGCRGNMTTRKRLDHLRHILRACCRRGYSNKRGQLSGNQLIEDLPLAIPPDADIKKKRVADLSEIGKGYDACEIARWPQSTVFRPAPVALWRLLWVLSYTYGPRTEDLLSLRWDSIHWDSLCPADEIARLEWKFGWLVYTPKKTRRHKPTPLRLPLTECARLHLESLRSLRLRRPDGPIFGFPTNKRDLHKQRRAIWRQAGIDEGYTFQELRKTCSTTWNDLRPGLGEHVTGHAPRGVNAVHYDTDLRRLCQLVPQFPQPEAFLKGVGLEAFEPSARLELSELEMAEFILAEIKARRIGGGGAS